MEKNLLLAVTKQSQGQKVSITRIITLPVLVALQEAAKASGISQSRIIELALIDYLELAQKIKK
jgi:hypothetical protein